jgi:hypothetical protein
MQTSIIPSQRAVEFGIYRDGDNNLDASQGDVLNQAIQVSAKEPKVAFTVEDTTQRAGDELHTDRYTIADGKVQQPHAGAPDDMASPENLAKFVARTLDEAQRNGATQTWIDLVDHGAGDGGGLEADSTGHVMPMPQIANAIADGVALHAKEHPEDASRGVDGVVANQCLMSSLGFADALSHAGVKYLAASPETMVSPGVPSTVADAIAQHIDDPKAMADAVVDNVMGTKYDPGIGAPYGPAAAFDVLDLDGKKMRAVESSVKSLNDALADAARHNRSTRSAIREDVKANDGMVRFPGSKGLPWHADRPAIATYNTLASDGRLDDSLRAKAHAASDAVRDLVLSHKESDDFTPFGGSDYSDAAGPTVHLPTSPRQIDPWAPAVSETNSRFFRETDEVKAISAIA